MTEENQPSYIPPLDPAGVPVPEPPTTTQPQVGGSQLSPQSDGAGSPVVSLGRSEEQRPGEGSKEPIQGIESHGTAQGNARPQASPHAGVIAEPSQEHVSAEELVRTGEGNDDARISIPIPKGSPQGSSNTAM